MFSNIKLILEQPGAVVLEEMIEACLSVILPGLRSLADTSQMFSEEALHVPPLDPSVRCHL